MSAHHHQGERNTDEGERSEQDQVGGEAHQATSRADGRGTSAGLWRKVSITLPSNGSLFETRGHFAARRRAVIGSRGPPTSPSPQRIDGREDQGLWGFPEPG